MNKETFESNRPNAANKDSIQFVVFTGPALSGKTTAAQRMSQRLNKLEILTYRDSFEAPMRCYLNMLMAAKSETMPPDTVVPGLGKTPRDFMLREQQHMRFTYGPSILGRLLMHRSLQWKKRPQYIVVDDGTSYSDVAYLGSYVVIRMSRESVERVYPFEIPNPNYVLSNKGDLNSLNISVDKMTDHITNWGQSNAKA